MRAPTESDYRPVDFGQILDRAFVLYRRNWRLAMGLSFPVLFPSSLVVGLSNIGYQWAIRTQIGQLGSDRPASSEMALAGLAVAAFFAATSIHGLLSLVVQGMLTRAGSELFLNGPVTAREMYRLGVRRTVVLVVTVILMTIGITAGFFALVIPGIVVSVYWAFVVQVVMIEDESLVGALSRSWKLVEGQWWHTAVFVFLLAMLVWVLELIVVVPSQVLGIVELVSHPEAIFPGETPNILSMAAQGIFGAIAVSLIAPVTAFSMTLFYYDLRARQEGFDIQLRAGRLMGDESEAGVRD